MMLQIQTMPWMRMKVERATGVSFFSNHFDAAI